MKPWHKIAHGEWQSGGLERYRAVRGWADAPGWTLLHVTGTDVDVLDTLPTLRACKEAAAAHAAARSR